MDLSNYLTAIRRSWWIIVVLTLIGGGVALIKSEAATPIYAAHVTFYVTPATSTSTTLSSDQFAQDKAKSYADLLSSDLLARMISAKLGGSPSQDTIRREITGSVDLNTVLVSAVIKDASRARALDLATALSKEFPSMVKSLDTVGSKGSPLVSLRLVSGPRVGTGPVSPRKQFDVILGLAIGLILGLLVAVARFALSMSRHSQQVLVQGSEGETHQPVAGRRHIDFSRSANTTALPRHEADETGISR